MKHFSFKNYIKLIFSVLIVLSIFLYNTSAFATVDELNQINNSRAQLDKINQQKQAVQNKIKQLNRLKNDTENYIKELDKTLEQLTEQLNITLENIDLKQAEIDETNVNLNITKENERIQYANMKKRIIFFYERNNASVIEDILSGDNLVDMLTRGEYIQSITDYDRQKLDELKKIENEIIELEKKLSQEKDELVLLRQEETANKGIQAAGKGMQTLDKMTGMSKYLKGMLKDNLGRPALYAMDSLISGDDCGFWHLTIGNPYNPIMVIGNLIMTNSTVQQFGPLGVDDFPTEVKVTCTVKPGRSRDMSEISRYYTQGLNGIYISKVGQPSTDFHKWGGMQFDEVEYREKLQKEKEKNSNAEPTSKGNPPAVDNGPSEDLKYNILEQTLRESNEYETNNISIDINSDTAGRLFTTNNYSQLYHIKAHDQVDLA